ncbi:HypC/HybG/HupF family hydrogenase formation chaperone [Ktedonospora formicarum]|uniref:Uncharacterized protein n=1 Tax=Ktedonospora formicarum TaxID=2778364 RepID=A0A8J3MND2_9CHLR|nr:HypC/HybG/HupF family hydrogenase formation chaperone [Ktedonospora formicarum]GHO42597.1 hypothetical protein KSX_07600 [Ktedonospora formicarum]
MTESTNSYNDNSLEARLHEYQKCHIRAGEHCVTCGDEALPAHVLWVDQEAGLALVQVEDEQEEVDITLLDALTPGDIILVHGGVGMTRYEEVRDE